MDTIGTVVDSIVAEQNLAGNILFDDKLSDKDRTAVIQKVADIHRQQGGDLRVVSAQVIAGQKEQAAVEKNISADSSQREKWINKAGAENMAAAERAAKTSPGKMAAFVRRFGYTPK